MEKSRKLPKPLSQAIQAAAGFESLVIEFDVQYNAGLEAARTGQGLNEAKASVAAAAATALKLYDVVAVNALMAVTAALQVRTFVDEASDPSTPCDGAEEIERWLNTARRAARAVRAARREV